MNRRPAILVAAVAGLVSAAMLFGCSGSDESSGSEGAGTAAEQSSGKVDPPVGTTAPASSGDKVPDAPDNAISDRPGGPNEGGTGGQGADGQQ